MKVVQSFVLSGSLILLLIACANVTPTPAFPPATVATLPTTALSNSPTSVPASPTAPPPAVLSTPVSIPSPTAAASPTAPPSPVPPAAAASASPTSVPSSTTAQLRAVNVPLPNGAGGIGFDDLVYEVQTARVIVPAGRTGLLDLIDPGTLQVTSIPGFSAQQDFGGGHGDGTTSADAGRGALFAIDRTALKLDVVDPSKEAIVASARLGGNPDYIRYVAATSELWVTEPDNEQIEIFTLPEGNNPTPQHAAFIRIAGGPESLVVDNTHGRAYTHLWNGATVAIDVKTRALVATWPNGCQGSRGIALDVTRGFLFAGCEEGKAVVLDVNHNGKPLSSLSFGSGVDVISYSPQLAHLYLPGAGSGTMAILGVSAVGGLSLLGTVDTATGAHCVTADDRGNAWVCDPSRGQILLIQDPFPANGR